MRTTATDTTATPALPLRERLLGWREILETANPPESRPLDTVGKWLVITRAAVFPMTIWSGLIGGLLAFVTAVIGRWRLPLIGTALLVVSSLVIGSIYPAIVQCFQVEPTARQ